MDKILIFQRELAEREGFEPPIPLRVCRISSAVHSTTLPPLQFRGRARGRNLLMPPPLRKCGRTPDADPPENLLAAREFSGRDGTIAHAGHFRAVVQALLLGWTSWVIWTNPPDSGRQT